ncbi:transcriptional regulator [Virgibacillus profundi]|uniref:Transcriptional regulator n=1 Tax=Virgibacillus profundi TaxID=2024555 RepID=A0A2A2IBS1_9BACI|nr:helix-turn-helix transcriptional regulator [Virgibacillus profundi]PAV28523.1 transcriptional regulator [Virgibacillus profundi]PXY52696.1 transcriptional regulator [Virgibacillus profundi]
MKKGNLDNKVYLFRTQARLSQEKLAKKVGVTRQTINALEHNRYNPSLVLAFEIAYVFDKSIEEIFSYSKEVNHE